MVVTRFAPSPTGLLHLGHAYSALLAYDLARKSNGRFILRLEDIDPERCKAEYGEAIREDLRWLGINWEDPVRRQSQHMSDYRGALEILETRGLVYPCFCSRTDIEHAQVLRAPHGSGGSLYPGTCRLLSDSARWRKISDGAPYSLRLNMKAALETVDKTSLIWEDALQGVQEARPDLFGDIVLARKDISTSYHLAVTLDDALQGVTLVTRGMDLFEATHIHRLLQALFDLPVPKYHHHPLVTGEHGNRLAKRDHSKTLRSLRQAGETPQTIRKRVGLPGITS